MSVAQKFHDPGTLRMRPRRKEFGTALEAELKSGPHSQIMYETRTVPNPRGF